MGKAMLSLPPSPEALPVVSATLYKIGMSGVPRESVQSETGLKQLLLEMRGELTRFMLARKCDPSEVEDLLQDLYVKLSSIHMGPVSNPRAYLYQITNNLLHDHRRGGTRQKSRDDHWARNQFGHNLDRDPEPSPEQSAVDRDELERVEQAIASMPQRTAEILKRYGVEGQTQKSIASSLAISQSAVEKHLQRAYSALLQLRQELDAAPDATGREADDVSFS